MVGGGVLNDDSSLIFSFLRVNDTSLAMLSAVLAGHFSPPLPLSSHHSMMSRSSSEGSCVLLSAPEDDDAFAANANLSEGEEEARRVIGCEKQTSEHAC